MSVEPWSVAGASIEQLQRTAEQTIEAAAAALLWTGQDSRGVLEHVAGTSAALMVEARRAYALFQAARHEVAAKDRQAFDADLGNWVVAGSFEVAALPAAAARPWTESVTAALVEAAAGMVCPAADSAGQLQALKGSMRCIALTVCSCWGQDPLPLRVIENSARIVCVHQASSARLHQF